MYNSYLQHDRQGLFNNQIILEKNIDIFNKISVAGCAIKHLLKCLLYGCTTLAILHPTALG